MREDGSEAVLAAFCENVFEIARQIAVAFVQINEKRPIWCAPPLRVEEERAHQQPAEEVCVPLVYAGAAGEIAQDDVAAIHRIAEVDDSVGLPDHSADRRGSH